MIGLLILSGLMMVTFWWAARRQAMTSAVVAIILWFLLLVLLMAPPVLWLNLLALGGVAAVCSKLKVKSRWSALASLFATTLVYLVFGVSYHARYRQLAQLTDQFPPVSVVDRLSYEHQGRQGATDSDRLPAETAIAGRQTSEAAIAETARLEEKLEQWDDRYWDRRNRRYTLSRLNSIHDQVVQEFASTQGFGVTRGRRMRFEPSLIDLPELPALSYPEILELVSGEIQAAERDDLEEIGQAHETQPVAAIRDALREVHEAGVVDFANRDGFGYVASREQVFGFQSHGFRNRPELPATGELASRWRIASLELVSLLKHEHPTVYVSKFLPRMDEIADVPVRPLDAFETSALGKLRSGEEIVVEERSDELQMLGSLRAAKQCTECHSVNRGELLGAFTYRLRREGPVRRPAPAAIKPVL